MKTKLPFSLAFLVASSLLAHSADRSDAVQAQPVPIPVPPAAPAGPESAEPVPAPVRPQYGVPRTNGRNRRVDAVFPESGQAPTAGAAATELSLDKANHLLKTIQLFDDDSPLPRTTKTGRTLIIQSTERDQATIANAEEDLSVMALILRKATGGPRPEERRVALGVELDSSVFGSSSGARNIYLEGYGALFLLGVRYPLIAPTEVNKDTSGSDNSTNEWVRAREEFLNSGPARFQVALDQIYTRQLRQAAEQYDATKVEELKTALFQALKNVFHIRILKPTDFVSIVIQGGEVTRTEKAPKGNKNNRTETRATETVMTMRVRAADAIAFGKGELDLAKLRQRTVIQTYLRRGDSSVGTAAFMTVPEAR